MENLSLFCKAHNQFAGRRDGLIVGRGSSSLRAVDTDVAAGDVDGLMDGPDESLRARGEVLGRPPARPQPL